MLGNNRPRATQAVHTFQDVCMIISNWGRRGEKRANWRLKLYQTSQEPDVGKQRQQLA